MDSSDVLQLIIFVVLLLASAFFSSAETAVVTVNKLQLQALSDEGNRQAQKLLSLMKNPGRLLHTVLVGDTIVNLSAVSLSVLWSLRVFGAGTAVFSTVVIILLVVLLGEITPRTIASCHGERLALGYVPVLSVLVKILSPLTFLFEKAAEGILILLRIDRSRKRPTITEEELLNIVDTGHEEGVIETQERQIIYNLFDFGDSQAKDVMVPRTDMSMVNVDTTYEELLEIFREDGYTRYPVYENSADTIIGTINMKDLLLRDHRTNFSIREILREPYFTYEHKSTADLLVEMKKYSVNLAIVLDEYGAIAGMITLEDLLEEIVGEIRDEYDADEEEAFREIIPRREYVAQGSMKLDDLNELMQLGLESEENDTLGGYIMEKMDRLPKTGEALTTENGIKLRVEKREKNRIAMVRIYIPVDFYEKKTQEEES